MTGSTLDSWLPGAAVRTVQRRSASAAPDALWAAAGSIRLADTRRLGRMVRWRIPGLDGALHYHEMFRTYPFVVLEESACGLVSGLCGRIWTLARDYPTLADAAEPVDARARLRLKAVWAVLGPFAHLVASEPLELAARRAERQPQQ